MNIHSIYRPLLRFFRARRRRLFYSLITLQDTETILDVGGYHWFWRNMGCRNHITCLNLHIPDLHEPLPEQFEYNRGDAREMPYTEQSYDLVFSNSVIEHLSTFDEQKRFAKEVRRVGKRYWVQTPNRFFFVEPHLIAPFIHFLPKTVQRRLIRWFTIWGLVTRPSPDAVNAFLAEVRLLTGNEMQALFPDATIVYERFLGMKKSVIAVKTPTANRDECP